MYLFQTEENAIPVFWINKETWNEEYRHIIYSALDQKRTCLLIPTKKYGIVEIACLQKSDFPEQIKNIDKLLTL